MSERIFNSVYDHKIPVDHIGLLYRIAALAKVGVAASGTSMAIDLREDGHQELYEMIADLASEAVGLAEEDAMGRRRKEGAE